MRIREIYKIGACCWILADFFSDDEIKKDINSTIFRKLYNRLKETEKEFSIVADSALALVSIERNANRYIRDMSTGKEIGHHATAEQMHQFSLSAEYLESWLDTLYVFKTPEKKEALNKRINKQIKIMLGKDKDDMTLLLEWLQTQEGSIAVETVKNKCIQVKNQL